MISVLHEVNRGGKGTNNYLFVFYTVRFFKCYFFCRQPKITYFCKKIIITHEKSSIRIDSCLSRHNIL